MQKEVLELDLSNTDFKALDKEIELLSAQDTLRLQIDQGLEQSLAELKNLEAQLPKEQGETLLKLCEERVMDTIISQFGLTYVLESKDGGLVSTTHNVRQGIYANEKEKLAYENRAEYDSKSYHQHEEYIKINKSQGELKKQGQLKDYMTGKTLSANDKTDLDHIVAAKTIHDDRARILADIGGENLVNTSSNLKMTDPSLNRSKKAKTAEEFLAHRDKRIADLERLEQKNGQLTQSQQNEKIKLEKQKEINDEEFLKIYDEEKKKIDKKVDKAYYTSGKPYQELLATGASQAARAALYSIFGMLMKEFVQGMMIEVRAIFANKGKESLAEIFARFKKRMYAIMENIKQNWKSLFSGSIEAAIMAFLSNIVLFVINIFATTLKKISQVIMAGFHSLCEAVKILVNPPKDMPKDEVAYAALKVIITGISSALSLLGAEVIEKFIISTLPLLTPIAEPIAITLSAIGAGLVSTIIIYFMDKIRSQGKIAGLQVQIMAQSGVVVQYSLAKTWLSLGDAYTQTARDIDTMQKVITQAQVNIHKSAKRADEADLKRAELMNKLKQLNNKKLIKE
ncbi:hypothetical protein CQA38_03190 [Campylobacter sp. MIT 12-5580]|uniref:hypothetical protein n=1 Tax=Campylobacter sp. MIT 12-5580 TaxID=2040651 RepID=UPI0010F4CB42|nr:hypothetical protein [Campylobacter sp. MIT 12-5580]TKX29790.1 hypothetical protein CQA38_03190 [Campylobacter sp. MIT 12-5580]